MVSNASQLCDVLLMSEDAMGMGGAAGTMMSDAPLIVLITDSLSWSSCAADDEAPAMVPGTNRTRLLQAAAPGSGSGSSSPGSGSGSNSCLLGSAVGPNPGSDPTPAPLCLVQDLTISGLPQQLVTTPPSPDTPLMPPPLLPDVRPSTPDQVVDLQGTAALLTLSPGCMLTLQLITLANLGTNSLTVRGGPGH